MITKRVVMVAVGFLLLGSTPLVASSLASADQATKVVTIEGKDSFQANAYLLNTYHFVPGLIKARHGQQILFQNKTIDAHSMTLVVAADLPRTTAEVFNCRLCNAVNKLYGLSQGGGPPKGVQIDNGVLQDANDLDADTPDPAAPGPFGALIEDFINVAHSNAHGAPTIGDSTLLGPVGSPAPTSRTVIVTAPAGVTLHYYCTIHPWMQASILVTS